MREIIFYFLKYDMYQTNERNAIHGRGWISNAQSYFRTV